MSQSPASLKNELESVIGESVYCALGLRDTLIEERDALRRQDSTAIIDAATRKKTCILKLEELEEKRAEISESCGYGRSPAEMKSLAQCLDEGHEESAMLNCWNHFMDIAHQCFDLNTSNGAIIRVRKNQIMNSLSTLRGGTENEATYGPGGSGQLVERARSLAEA